MAVFSRRTLQRILDENAKFLSPSHVKSHVNRLNRMGTELSLDAEWEVVLLNGFSKIGQVVHEKKFAGSKKVDIYFEPADHPERNFLADVTAISDRGINKQTRFSRCLTNLWISSGTKDSDNSRSVSKLELAKAATARAGRK